MPIQRSLTRLCSPYFRHELPGWGRLGEQVGLTRTHDPAWAGHPIATMRDKYSGALFALDLSCWEERLCYFLGRPVDLEVLLALQRHVRPGDRVFDVGANIGQFSLTCAHLVGESGQVESFEPNPHAHKRLLESVALNPELERRLRIHNVGLGEQASTATLRHPAGHSGAGTIRKLSPGEQSVFSSEVQVEIVHGDAYVDPQPRVAVIKIDVEGLEIQVLRGLDRLIERDRPTLLVEVLAEEDDRESVEAVHEFFEGRGYSAHELRTKRQGLRHVLHTAPLDLRKLPRTANILFMADSAPSPG